MISAAKVPSRSPRSDGPPLVVKNLNKQYKGGIWANRDISLTAEAGEILGILGPNGAGKTTLVRQITTELLPTSGEVRVLGYDVAAEPVKVKALMGIMPQEATLFDDLTAYQHLRIFGKLRGLSPKDASHRAEELIAELRLSDYRDTPVRKTSGGLRRRILVGIASLARPPIMVLDEPTTGLDPQSRRDLWGVLRRCREQGTTVLITTHYMEEAESLCDRVGIIQDGGLLALDTVANLRSAHGYEFKVTYVADGPSEKPVTLYGAKDDELLERVRSMGVNHFAISRTSLEDVYLALTGGDEGFDDRSD